MSLNLILFSFLNQELQLDYKFYIICNQRQNAEDKFLSSCHFNKTSNG